VANTQCMLMGNFPCAVNLFIYSTSGIDNAIM